MLINGRYQLYDKNRQTFTLDASTNQTVQALDNLGPDVRPYHLCEEGSIFQSLDQITEVGGSLSVNTNTVLISLSTSFG